MLDPISLDVMETAAAATALRGAMRLNQEPTASNPGTTMELTPTEARIIYWRNMVVLLLSLVVGTKTLLAILWWVGGHAWMDARTAASGM